MMTKRLLILMFSFAPVLTWALEIVPYDAESFSRARLSGKVTALQFHSGWCPICVMQTRALRELKNDPALAGVIVFQADFAKEEALRKRFGVQSFSTLVIFRGMEERTRATGDIQVDRLKQLFAKAL